MARGKTSAARQGNATRFALAFCGLFALVGLILLAVTWLPVWNDYRHGRQFAAEGALASGMVLTKSRTNAGSVTVLGNTRRLTDYSVRYRFTTHGGQTLEGHANVTPEEWGLLDERGFIKVRYLPDDPATNVVSGQVGSRNTTAMLTFTLLGVIFTAIGGLMLHVILKEGKPAR